eukprot:7424734-Ditylum_brightwellii.AAC.1
MKQQTITKKRLITMTKRMTVVPFSGMSIPQHKNYKAEHHGLKFINVTYVNPLRAFHVITKH